MDHNAWSPAGPGKHGYMQVGLGRDRKLFNEGGDYRHVFVGAGKHFLYCGWYHVQRVEPLTKEEWATLPTKHTYSETTVNKEKSGLLKSGQQALDMYNSGELHAPCVRLRCEGFDTAFYQELVRANDQFFQHKPRPTPPSTTSGAGPSKRRRVSNIKETAKDDETEAEISLVLPLKSQKSVLGASLPVLPTSSSTQTPSGSVAPSLSAVKVSPDDQLPSMRSPTDVGAVSSSAPDSPTTSTRSQSGLQTVSIKLRIPGGKSMNLTPRSEVDDLDESELSADPSDHDDMYADY
ncbi:hypothetical protein BC628DRAFT_1408103 [Trametes gibbosa]|nr:hypothetical protein BC628DRAFT_1408103 [Trametes gibbosa]